MKFKRAQWVLVSVLVAGAFVAGWHLKARGGDAAQETSSTGAAAKEKASWLSFHQEEFIHPLVVDVMVGSGIDVNNLGASEETTVCSLNLSSPYMFDLFDNLYRLSRPLLDWEEREKLLSFNVVNQDGRVWVKWQGEHGAFVHYSHIGTSSSGVEIVQVRGSGGGTGVFCQVAFFKIETEPIFPEKDERYVSAIRDAVANVMPKTDGLAPNERKVLKILGKLDIGDRYKGRIVYEDGILHISANENRLGGGSHMDNLSLSVPVP